MTTVGFHIGLSCDKCCGCCSYRYWNCFRAVLSGKKRAEKPKKRQARPDRKRRMVVEEDEEEDEEDHGTEETITEEGGEEIVQNLLKGLMHVSSKVLSGSVSCCSVLIGFVAVLC